ncbi:type II toxin-antitoxin system RelE/ParE family toxin [Dyadobacter chenwenxiniae]|uniref:Type II toxin-antitoxin system RelE/ParE family toxin n=1 Tax=Dyadobacter chenwenxiniae TaxID=2906456 RepID=A0A9X1PJ76_9BACT|nr:type II toxin-antitoxin system RelE/ParE family toxin [Dyadobacter chenwenxiniae]MCF0061726.1 type II toxin-antitoxin system RelE/ParE family toxin [Dyadobacter chenwenxiniae]UON81544.1 type II toxin-antitoxin system RelE/ParE family toxin [Dyadobacter chenwenxiniae]
MQKAFDLQYFHTLFLEEAEKFLATLSPKAARKVIYNVELAQKTNDPRLFKKLGDDIWEFRTNYSGDCIRLLAFWDKTDGKNTLVVATNGFVKKNEQGFR